MRALTRSLSALAAGSVLAIGLTACSSTVPTDSLETEVERLATDQGLDVESVDCPDELPAEVDASVVCTVTEANGEERDLDVTATSVDGDNVNFDVKEQ